MRRISYKPYVCLAIALFTALSLSTKASDAMRSCAVAGVSLPWKMLVGFKKSFSRLAAFLPSGKEAALPKMAQEMQALIQENHNLRAQVALLQNVLALSGQVAEELKTLKLYNERDPFFQRRAQELRRLIDLQMHAVGAKVIFREPASWSSCLWIDVGEKQNEALGATVVAKNSPVVAGACLVGVIEYVGKNRSRVRLITDPGLCPSVRAIRGNLHDHPLFLAKGEIQGSIQLKARCRSLRLKGAGFNYDFADEEGPARHLLTGEPIDHLGHGNKVMLVQKGDLLITTGLDGVFPANLQVASVDKVQPARDGASFFELEATAAVRNLDELTFLTVLPALSIRDE